MPETTCETVLSEDERNVLWLSPEHNQPIPKTAPSTRWALYAIAKPGGFADTKRTTTGWDTVWRGWFRLRERLEGYQLSKSALTEL